jgi:predicted nucleic acid-binding protein
MIDVVVDTNVLVSAIRSNLGASYLLLQLLEGRLWRPVISPTLALEYEAVLKRETVRGAITREDIDDFLDYLLSRALLVQIYFRWRPALPDPNDECILELAIRAQEPIITLMPGTSPARKVSGLT